MCQLMYSHLGTSFVVMQGGLPESVALLTSHKEQLEANKELSINYGNKSNEELLHLYGMPLFIRS